MIFSQYFGNYLLERRLLTPEQLRVALEKLSSVHVKLGVLAMEAQFMTAAQVDEVRAVQKAQDRRFGEIALEKGFLTTLQLDGLLHRQVPEHVLLSQALVDMGVFTFAQLEQYMEEYRLAHAFDPASFEAAKYNDIDTLLSATLGMNDPKLERYKEYVIVFVKNLVRFIDADVRLAQATAIDRYPYRWLASQGVQGGLTLFTAFSAPEPVLLAFAQRYADMQIGAMDDLACDSLGEFLNCQNGIFASNLHNQGVHVDLMPQEVNSDGLVTNRGTMLCIPIHLGIGSLDLILADFYPSYEQL